MIRRYFIIYYSFIKAYLKTIVEYKTDFFIGAISTFIFQFTTIIFMSIIFIHIEDISGWNFYEILFIQGIAAAGRSIHHIFFDNLWVFGSQYIRTGNFDRLLVRPINPLFHLISEKIQQDGIGQFLVSVIILTISIPNLEITWMWYDFFLLVLMIIASGMIFVSLNLIYATLSFWMVDSFPVLWIMYNFGSFAEYPVTIYNKYIIVILTWIIPYAFTSFYPSTLFFGETGFENLAMLTPLVAAIAMLVSYLFWKLGIKHYTSTGI